MTKAVSKDLKAMLRDVNITKRFEEILGENAAGFVTSILQVVNGNKQLQEADPATIINAAATAASMKLPIIPALGQSYIVPYGKVAQFQIGWKGLVQLALRTKQYARIINEVVYVNQFKSWNAFTEHLEVDTTVKGEGEVHGFLAFFMTVNGFQKTVYWTKAEVEAHGKKYSKSYTHSSGQWKQNFKSMGKKTVLKNALDKWGIKSIDMERAIMADQSVQSEFGKFDYIDNPETDIVDPDEISVNKQNERIRNHIEESVKKKDLDYLNQVAALVVEADLEDEFANAYKAITGKDLEH